jgi:hypothetical protein
MTMYFWLINAVLAALIFIPNNKLYLLCFLVPGIYLLFFHKQKLYSVLYTILLLTLPFDRGIRGWFFDVVSPGPESWMPGYSFYFGMSVKIIIFILLMILLIISPDKHPGESTRWTPPDYMLLTFVCFSAVSVYFSQDLMLALVGFIRLMFSVGLYFINSYFMKAKKDSGFILSLCLCWLFWFGLVGVWQAILKHPVGLFLEETDLTRPSGFYTSDGDLLYRVSGLTGHPTFFGSLLSLLLPVGVSVWLNEVEKKRTHGLFYIYVIFSVILGSVALVATFSRSAWISMLFCMFLFFLKTVKTRARFLKSKFIRSSLVMILVIMMLFGSSLITRTYTLSDLSHLGNATGRINLARHALDIIRDFPLFGSGINQFTRQLITHSLTIDERAFFYPVHNTFLLFFSELGIPAGLVFLLFVVVVLLKTLSLSFRKNWIMWGFWIGMITFVINAQFHTLFNLDPTLDLFMLFSSLLITQQKSWG